ncbi:MAG: hypothetical protein AABY15_04930 [Nanoarchaeota archaeon]
MGKTKYKQKIEELFKKSPIVSNASMAMIVNHKEKKKGYTKRMINYLIKKGLIKRLTKGTYTVNNNNSLIVLSFQPAYLGLQDALSFYDIWEQETIPVIITSRNVRSGIRNILGGNVLIRTINKKYLFGIEYQQQENIALPYSDIEKTFIDMIYFKEKLTDEAKKNIIKKINKKKLNSYLKAYPHRFRKMALKLLNSR